MTLHVVSGVILSPRVWSTHAALDSDPHLFAQIVVMLLLTSRSSWRLSKQSHRVVPLGQREQ